MKRLRIIAVDYNIWRTALLTVLCLLFASCSMMHQDEEDCSTNMRVRFKYDYNMKFADAFGHEVKTVTLYAFDVSGTLAYKRTESAEVINATGYMDVSDIEPGIYNLMVWAEGEERRQDSYIFGQAETGSKDIGSLTCRINRTGSEINHDLTPLFWGRAENQDLTRIERGGVRMAEVSLVKNTNVVRVVLQQQSPEAADASKFSFEITDNNGWLNHENNVLYEDSPITYRPWSVTSGTADMEGTGDAYKAAEQTQVSVVVAELTVNRLVMSNSPRLTVRNDKDGIVFSIPLINYVLLVKGNYNRDMDDQEYLDRQDEYNMTFFLDKDGSWLSASIIINSWRVVLSNADL